MTAPAGSEDAGLVLSAQEHNDHGTNAGHLGWDRWVYPEDAVERIVATRVEVARAEERERIAAAIEAEWVEWFNHEHQPDGDAFGAFLRARQIVLNPSSAPRGPWRKPTSEGYSTLEESAAADDAARIARTPPPAGDAQGSQEARNGPVSAGDAGDGRGHGRDDESGRGAGL